jgi:hypothetical protein
MFIETYSAEELTLYWNIYFIPYDFYITYSI